MCSSSFFDAWILDTGHFRSLYLLIITVIISAFIECFASKDLKPFYIEVGLHYYLPLLVGKQRG